MNAQAVAEQIVQDCRDWFEAFGGWTVPAEKSAALISNLVREEYTELIESIQAVSKESTGQVDDWLSPQFSCDHRKTVDALVDLVWVTANYLVMTGKSLTKLEPTQTIGVSHYYFCEALRKGHSVKTCRARAAQLIHATTAAGLRYYPDLFVPWSKRVRAANFAKLWTMEQTLKAPAEWSVTDSTIHGRYVVRNAAGKIQKPPGWVGPEHYRNLE